MLAGSIVLDIADGAVARLVGATSPFGVQLDSLADLVSFGLAPAVLVHTWALPENPVLAWLSAFFWLACAAFRLARFNVTVDPLADKKYFVGLPSPGATLVVIATILALAHPRARSRDARAGGRQRRTRAADGDHRALPVLPWPALAAGPARRGPPPPSSRSPSSSGWCSTPAATGLVVACAYLLTAPLGVLTAPVRARVFGPQAVAPPGTGCSRCSCRSSRTPPTTSADPVPASWAGNCLARALDGAQEPRDSDDSSQAFNLTVDA